MLEQKTIAFSPKDTVLRCVSCIPLNNEHTDEDFIDFHFDMTNKHSLIGKVVYHNESDNTINIEVEEPNISMELDLDLFNYKIVGE